MSTVQDKSTLNIPEAISREVPGCPDVIFCREDMTNIYSWYQLAVEGSIALDETDFVDRDQFYRYLFIATGLMDYPCIFVMGDVGQGKSLAQAFFASRMVELFPPKRTTVDWYVPKPELYGKGKLFWMNDMNFVIKLKNDINTAAQLGRPLTLKEKEELVFYNTFFSLDEMKGYGDSGYQTNPIRLISNLSTIRRHYHVGMMMAYLKPKDVPGRLLWENRTHEIRCFKNYKLPGWCSYEIYNINTRYSRWIHLNPSDWIDYWDTHAPVAVSHDIYVKLTGEKKKKEREL